MDRIPSPYNFVPLEEKVFFPSWSNAVSMDVPFSDGISGTMELKVTARTPLYIRSGGAHPKDSGQRLNDRNYSDFFRAFLGGPYAIPGTSLKGMLREVVEIVSFGKIAGSKGKTARVDDRRYAVRDLQNPVLYTGKITAEVGQRTYQAKVRAGWLKLGENNRWELTFCDMARVEQEDLERFFKKTINRTINLGNPAIAKEKYELLPPYTELEFDPGPEKDHLHSGGNRLRYRKANKLGDGNTKGVLVMTGQPSRRKPSGGHGSRGKHMEFIFFNPEKSSIPVPVRVKQDFEFAHSDLGENRKENKEWAFWKEKFKQGKEIPVFVLEEGRSGISSMGLAMMFRLPYIHSIHQTIEHTSEDHLQASRLDLGELLFGRVEDTEALRGRISVETLLAEGTPQPMDMVKTVLGSPKPTYYPNYVKQEAADDGFVHKNYKTYMDSDAEIRGWKRYIVREDGYQPHPESAPKESVETRFRPLPAGTAFTGTIHVHNLRPQELGALLWAITWGGDAALRHSLGMGKPLGYGSVSLSIEHAALGWCNPAVSSPVDLEECQKAFVEMMEHFLGKSSWEKSDALRALTTMANPQEKPKHDLRYPVLGRGRDGNEFVNFKRRNEERALISPLGGLSVGGNSPSDNPSDLKKDKSKVPQKPAPPIVQQKKKELSPAEKFCDGLDKMRNKDILKVLKKKEIDPEAIDPELKKKIAKKLKNYSNDFQFKPFLKDWLD